MSDPYTAYLLDNATGEVVPSTSFLVPRREKMSTPFVMLFQSSVDTLLDREIDGTTLRVFLCFVQRADYGNWVHTTQRAIGQHLGISKPQMSRAVSILIKKGLLEKDNYKPGLYRVNPDITWRGRASHHREAHNVEYHPTA